MEESLDLPRRRSSFFARRNSLASSTRVEDPVTLRYLEKLEAEYCAWKKLYDDRKTRYNDLKRKGELDEREQKHASTPENIPEDVTIFLQNKPDIDAIQKSSIKLCRDRIQAIELYREFIDSNERMTLLLKNYTSEAKKRILDSSIFENKNNSLIDINETI